MGPQYYGKRDLFGEYHHLVDDLQDRFYTYFLMSEKHFEELHCLLKDKLCKKNTNWRKAIETKERLAICLRYVYLINMLNLISLY